MAREDHRRATGSLSAENLGQGAHGKRVETGERLVEHEQLRLVHQRSRQLRPLLVAVRELLDLRPGTVGEPQALEPPSRSGLGRARPETMQPAEVLELLPDRHPRVETALFGHVAEAQPLLQPHRAPVPQHIAGVDLDEPEHRAHGRRLAGAVRAEEAEHPPGLDREREVGEGLHGLEPFAHMDEAETVHAP